MQTSQKETFLFNDSLECSLAFQVRGICYPLGSSERTWTSLLRHTGWGQDTLQALLHIF